MESTAQVRILIIDDHPLTREGIKLGLKSKENWVVCGEAESVMTALHLVRVLSPDVVLLDLSLKEGDGMDLLKTLNALPRPPVILVCSMHDENIYAQKSIEAGAKGYVNKEHALTTLVEAIECVLGGDIYLSKSLSKKVLSGILKNLGS